MGWRFGFGRVGFCLKRWREVSRLAPDVGHTNGSEVLSIYSLFNFHEIAIVETKKASRAALGPATWEVPQGAPIDATQKE